MLQFPNQEGEHTFDRRDQRQIYYEFKKLADLHRKKDTMNWGITWPAIYLLIIYLPEFTFEC